VITTRSGNGWRATISEHGEIVVSVWAFTKDDAERMALREEPHYWVAKEERKAEMAAALAAQATAEFRELRVHA
jgi:hypothetical protein